MFRMVEQKLVIRSNPVVRGSNPVAKGSNPMAKASSANDSKAGRGGSNPVQATAARGRGGPARGSMFRNPQPRAMLVSRSR